MPVSLDGAAGKCMVNDLVLKKQGFQLRAVMFDVGLRAVKK
jgi:hypothetical protein